MSEAPDDLYYSTTHEWLRVEGTRGTVGITDYAQSELGDVVFVELPEVGASFTAGQSFGVIESVKAVSDLYAPMDGSVVAINEEVVDHPELVNESPYELGWLVCLELASPDATDELMDAERYLAQTEEE